MSPEPRPDSYGHAEDVLRALREDSKHIREEIEVEAKDHEVITKIIAERSRRIGWGEVTK